MQIKALIDACQQCMDADKTQQITWQQHQFICMTIKLMNQTRYILAMHSLYTPKQLLQRLEPWRFVDIQVAYLQQKLCVCYVLNAKNRNTIEDAIRLLIQIN
jgi:hypothetical protein